MRLIIAGCRHITDPVVIERALDACRRQPWFVEPTVILSGGQKTFSRDTGEPVGGADWLAEQWAAAHNIAVEVYPANWDDLTAPGAVIRTGYGGRYNAAAGPARNRLMASKAQALLAVWDQKSSGTRDMIAAARAAGLHVHVHIVPPAARQPRA